MGKLHLKEGDQNYTLMLFVSGMALMISGSSAIDSGWPLVWFGFGCVLVGAGYWRLGPGLFGKQLDGDRSWLNRIILFPYLLVNVVLWHLRHRVLSKEDTCNEIAPGIWLGRRPIDGEMPDGIKTVVDLTCEFSATPQARKLNYICVPTLDGLAPPDKDFDQLMHNLAASNDPIYIHCAAGHGRSAAIVVGLLVAKGVSKDLAEAERLVKAKRPKVSIKLPQRQMLNRWFAASQG